MGGLTERRSAPNDSGEQMMRGRSERERGGRDGSTKVLLL